MNRYIMGMARAAAATLPAALLAACGGGGGVGDAAPAATPAPVTAGEMVVSGRAAAIAAARQAAASDPLCSVEKMGDFYWEIGEAAGSAPIVGRAEGAGTVAAGTRFNIASASKFVFGAYVLEKKGIAAVRSDPVLRDALRFTSGYNGLSDEACIGTATVGACLSVGRGGKPVVPDPASVGKFDYNGGHDQKLAAVDLGLASYTPRQLDAEYQAVMRLPASIGMGPLVPLLAGGLTASASDFALFLRQVMNRQLVIGAHLGEDSVCANPLSCPGQVAYSPIVALNEPWRYSYNHWVESENGSQIDAYSSPGKWGFYPWISPDRNYYGIVSRHDTAPVAYGVSVKCGRQIRKAFLRGLGGS